MIKIKDKIQQCINLLERDGENTKSKVKGILKTIKADKYNYAKAHHSEFKSLPKDIRRYIETTNMESPEKYMFDVDVYYNIEVRNYWKKE